MIDKIQTVIARYNELGELMSQPDAMADMKAFTKMAREYRAMKELVEISQKYIKDYSLYLSELLFFFIPLFQLLILNSIKSLELI